MRNLAAGFLVGILVLPVIGLALILLGAVPVAATSTPPRWETFLARRAVTASVARQGARLSNPTAPNSESLRAGMKIYRMNCAGCHGDSEGPSQWGSTAFYPRVPQFNLEPPLRPDGELFWTVKYGVRYSGMGAWNGLLSDDDIWRVSGFLSRLSSLPADVEAEWRGKAAK